MKIWIFLAGINGAMAVAMGAYGWHQLGDVSEIRDVFMMGSEYQMWHALAMLGIGVQLTRLKTAGWQKIAHAAGGSFQVGIVLFCGTLYAFGLANMIPVDGAAPLGGVLLIAGWLALALTAFAGRANTG